MMRDGLRRFAIVLIPHPHTGHTQTFPTITNYYGF